MDFEVTTRKIEKLEELQPGDHIRVPTSGSGSRSSFSFSTKSGSSKSTSDGCSSPYTHHLLVVRVIDNKNLKVIHKNDQGVIEEKLPFKVEAITVLDYDSKYKGREAIKKARNMSDQKYSLLNANCEHFVFEARTGEKHSMQVPAAKRGLAFAGGGGAAIGAAVGSAVPILGTISGALVFGTFGFLLGAFYGTERGAAMVNNQ